MTITKDEIGNNFNDLTSNEITKEEADELLNKLSNLNWWEQEESSQFTGIETFYGFNSESKAEFLKEGIPAKCYTFKLDIDGPSAAIIRKCNGPVWSVKFDGEADYKDFLDKVLWNNTFSISLEPDDKVRVFKMIDDENGFEVREQEIADEGVKRLVDQLKKMHWLKNSLRDCEHRYFGFTDSGMENVKADADVGFHHSYYFELDPCGWQATLKDFMENEYVLRFPNGEVLKDFFDEVITPNLFTLDKEEDEERKTPTIEDIMNNISFVQKAVPKTMDETTLERIAVELKRQNDIREIEVMIQCANAAMQSLIQHKNGKEREEAWDFVDGKIKTATSMITNMVNGR